MSRRLVLLLLVAAATAGVVAALPPKARLIMPPPEAAAPPVRGAIHVHTRRSDGSGTVDDVMRAAAHAGLNFVIVTDHGDGTRAGDPPEYRSGVLYIDAVEISTDGGHVLGLGLPPSPYPLAGEPRDVVEDIARLGGFSIVAHPISDKESARWTEWTAPFSGIEWLNADSEWRDESMPQLARVLLAYPFRPVESLARILDRSDVTLRRWDALTQRRRVVAVAGADAHARISPSRDPASAWSRLALPVPGYEQMFRAFSTSLPALSLTGNAAADAASVINEIRSGRLYSVVDSLASPATFTFTGASGSERATMGEPLALNGPVTLTVGVNAPANATLSLYVNGEETARGAGSHLTYTAGATPAVYRVEVALPGTAGETPVPWIVSNPIYVGRPVKEEPSQHPLTPVSASTRPVGTTTEEWQVEHSAQSQGAVDVMSTTGGGTQLLFRYALSGPRSESPYAAAVLRFPKMPPLYDRVTFRARASEPQRLSVQVRMPGGTAGSRWHRSVFIDPTPREVSVFFEDMTPRGDVPAVRPRLDELEALLFVVDTVNAKSGTSGQVAVENLRFEAAAGRRRSHR